MIDGRSRKHCRQVDHLIDCIAASGSAVLAPAQFDMDPAHNITPHTNTFLTGTSPAVTITKTGGGAIPEFTSNVPGLLVKITTGGALAVGKFDVSYNNGSTWAHTGVTLAATYALDGTATNLTLNFAAGTYVLNDTYEMRVGTWRSNEGNLYSFSQVTGGQCAVYRGVDVGTPYLQFDAVDDIYLCTTTGAWSWLQNSPAFTHIAKIYPDAFNTIRSYFSVGNSGQASNGDRRFGTTTTSAGRWFQGFTNDSGGTGPQNSATVPTIATHKLRWKSPGTTLTLAADGTTDATINAAACNPGTLTPNRACIGARSNLTPGGYFGGKIYRLLGWTSQLSDAQCAAWEAVI
jgi:hypothetical protein